MAMMSVVFKDKVRRNGDDVQGQGVMQWRHHLHEMG